MGRYTAKYVFIPSKIKTNIKVLYTTHAIFIQVDCNNVYGLFRLNSGDVFAHDAHGAILKD